MCLMEHFLMSLSNTFVGPQMNENFLVYTNVLIYSPRRPTDGVVRMEPATIPVECQFGRLIKVDINLRNNMHLFSRQVYPRFWMWVLPLDL